MPLKGETDELWEALVTEMGDVLTPSERGIRNKALKELRAIGATEGDIRSRCHAYRVKWPRMSLTATALVKHWSSLGSKPPPKHTPVAEVLNLPELSEDERQANLERARELARGKGMLA
jgi:hypothetical protein